MSEISRLVGDSSTLREANSVSKIQNNLQQEDFLKLLVAQMSHQDPMEPEKPGEFMGQLAQFSTVDGIQRLNSTVELMNNGLYSNQALQASSLVGRQVHVPSNKNILAQDRDMVGSTVVNTAVKDLTIQIKSADGQVVKKLNLGPYQQGNVDFTWDGIGDNGKPCALGEYSIEALGKTSNGSTALKTFSVVNVDSVTINPGSANVLLNLQGLGEFSINEVTKIA